MATFFLFFVLSRRNIRSSLNVSAVHTPGFSEAPLPSPEVSRSTRRILLRHCFPPPHFPHRIHFSPFRSHLYSDSIFSSIFFLCPRKGHSGHDQPCNTSDRPQNSCHGQDHTICYSRHSSQPPSTTCAYTLSSSSISLSSLLSVISSLYSCSAFS